MSAYEPDLQDMRGGVVIDAFSELFNEPRVLFGAWFFFDKNGAKFACFGEGLEGCLVQRLLLFV